MAKKSNRFITQATQDALVRFGPEISGLKALIQQAQSDRSTGIGAARSTAQSITSAVDAARPQVAGIYKQAAGTQNRVSDQVVHDIAGLTGVNPSIVAALDVEHAASSDRTSGSRAAALTDLTRQRVSAQRGKQWAIQSANRDFAASVGKVLQRRVDLADEQGAFISSQTGKARDAAAQRRQEMKKLSLSLSQQERSSIRSSGIDPVTGGLTQNAKTAKQKADAAAKAAAKAAADAKKPKKVTTDTQLSFGNTYQQALNNLRNQIDPARRGRAQGRYGLLNGVPADTSKTRNKAGLVETVTNHPEVKPVGNALAARVALDMYYDGHLSKETVRILRKNGIRVKALPGVRTPSQNVFNTKKPISGSVTVGAGTN